MDYNELLKIKQARSNQLVNSVLELHANSHKQAKLCKKCKFAFPKIMYKCPYCFSPQAEFINLDEQYMEKIANRYWQLGYAEKSLVVLENVDFKLGINANGKL
ncbi:hypothetical protein [Pseudoalteromonas sp. S3431]|uniref:hypothetical protein n=1 Tax=Pseudoalteromonas sp. S3431 TaxID=579537 RepID=UPI00049EDDB8|nr:hypothetical protein [Pseudoalteromonas sp. S3431]KDC51050.1 hypothetical protein DO88_16560 [Pseudoalteromonas sp. S3431]